MRRASRGSNHYFSRLVVKPYLKTIEYKFMIGYKYIQLVKPGIFRHPGYVPGIFRNLGFLSGFWFSGIFSGGFLSGFWFSGVFSGVDPPGRLRFPD
jgi:hypothetical protein